MTRNGDVDRTPPELAEQQRKAVELCDQGWPYDAIARKLGYESPVAAHHAIRRALAEIQRPAVEEYRTNLNRRYEALFRAAWPAAMQGDPKAIEAARRILDSLAKVNLPPHGVKIQVTSGPDPVDEEMQKLVAELDALEGRPRPKIIQAEGINNE